MTQVDYDYNFNKGYKDYDKIFQLSAHLSDDYDWQLWMARPMGELIAASSPHVKASTILTSFQGTPISRSMVTCSTNSYRPDSAIFCTPSNPK